MRDMSDRICTLALVLLLLGTFFSGYTTDHYAVYTEMGKEADLVVLGDDITKCDPEHIQDAPVLGTMVGGEWVYTHA